MNPFAKRRTVNTSILVMVVLVSWFSLQILDASIRATSFWTGWTLFFLVTTLALFNGRKKLPFLPIGSAASWMQYHIYAGIFAVLVYLAHAGFKLPVGALEFSLCFVFVAIALSGAIGTMFSRVIPVGLTSRGEPVLFERIPALRIGLQREVEDLVIGCVRDHQTETLSTFYMDYLDSFLRGPRNFLYHAMGWSRPLRELERESNALDRYLNDDEREIVAQIMERVRLKDDLDYQWSRQLLLKGWLFIHIPLTFSLLILALLHIFVVYGFRGNLP